MRIYKTFVLLLFVFGCNYLMAQVLDLQLSQTAGEVACEAHTAANPINGDIAVVYKVHPSSGSDSYVDCKVIRNGAVLYSHRITNATDPCVDYDGVGNLYVCWLSKPGFDVYIKKSTDNGASFSTPVLAAATVTGYGIDKQMMYIDKYPSSPGYNRIYIGYTVAPDALPSFIDMVYSTNGGMSFSTARTVSKKTPVGMFNTGVSFVSQADGKVYIFWYREIPGTDSVDTVGSGGSGGLRKIIPSKYVTPLVNTFLNGVVDSTLEQAVVPSVTRPGAYSAGYYYSKQINNRGGFRNGPFPYCAVDYETGSIYMVMNAMWFPSEQGQSFNYANNLFLCRSTNNGATWIPSNIVAEKDLFMPSICIAPGGRVAISCYDSNFPNSNNIDTKVSLMISDDYGVTFNKEQLTESFDIVNSRFGDYIGDYFSMARNTSAYFMAYSKPVNDKLQVFLYSRPLWQQVTLQNKKVDGSSVTNFDNTKLLLDSVSEYPSPSAVSIKYLKPISVQPKEVLYSPFRFLKWLTVSQNTRENLQHSMVTPSNSYFVSLFAKTKPLTISNYLEGSSAGSILFGESGTGMLQNDFQTRNSGYQENAFLYNAQQDILISYKAQAYENLSYLNTNWRFWKWDNGSTNVVREESITTTTAPEWKALYKSSQRSNASNAYANNNQRKIVRLGNGMLAQVYESMGAIWLEKSTDNGTTWQLANNNMPLSSATAKSPSVSTYDGTAVIVVFQQTSPLGSELPVRVYDFATSTLHNAYTITDVDNSRLPGFSTDASPVVAWGNAGHGVIAWYNIESLSSEIQYLGFSCGAPNGYLFTNTNHGYATSCLPSSGTLAHPALDYVYYYDAATSQHKYNVHLAWEKWTSGVPSVYYAQGVLNTGDHSVAWGAEQNISQGAGYTQNYGPSIISFRGGARMCWVGKRESDEFDMYGNVVIDQNVVFKDPSNSSMSWTFGDMVNSPSIGNNAEQKYLFAWTENNSSVKFADNSLSTIRTVSGKSGKDVQVTGGYAGTAFTDMYASVYNVSSAPYSFSTTANMQSYYGQSKAIAGGMGFGREGVLSKDSAQFYFCLGDISVDGNSLDFIEIPGQTPFTSCTDLNAVTRTKSFQVTGSTLVNYSVLYGVTNADNAASVLGQAGYVRFKVQLIEEGTGVVLGTFDDVTYTREQARKYANMAYELNTEALSGKTVYLALVAASNVNPGVSLTEKHADGYLVAKTKVNKLVLNSADKVTTYGLEQNYPNPFNPSTTISYQLPKAGLVTLKIYDMVGKEIKVLVNEYKETGRYTVEFNATGLASGVYMYRLDCNDYHATKKLTLLK